MPILKTIRQKLDLQKKESELLELNIWQGNALDVQLGIFNGAQVADASSIQSVTLRINPSRLDSKILASKTITSFDNTLDLASWNNGSKQHGLISLSNNETNLDLAKQCTNSFWISFTAILADGKERILGAGTITLHEGNNNATNPPPSNSGTALTVDEANSLYANKQAFDTHVDKVKHLGISIMTSTDVVGDGVTDDSSAIQSLLDSLGATAKVVVVPAGRKFKCKNLRLPDNTILKLDGDLEYGGSTPQGFVKSPDNPQDGIIHAYGTHGSRAKNIGIVGFGSLIGNRDADNWTEFKECDIIQFTWVDNIHFEGFRIKDCPQDSIELKGVRGGTVTRLRLEDSSDAAIEVRGSSDVHIFRNHMLRVRNAFMCKPFFSVANGNIDSERIFFTHNKTECFGSTILNNWANDSEFQNNSIQPLTVVSNTSGGQVTENGLSQVAIIHESHPQVPRDTLYQSGIRTSKNRFYGQFSSTLIRYGNATSYGRNYVEGNELMQGGACFRAIQAVGIFDIHNNIIPTITENPAWGILLTLKGECRARGNEMGGQFGVTGNSDLPILQTAHNTMTFMIPSQVSHISDNDKFDNLTIAAGNGRCSYEDTRIDNPSSGAPVVINSDNVKLSRHF